MKKMTFIVCGAMLASAVLFTGCKKDQNAPEKAPSVTTDVAISLPGQVGANGARHMPGTTVQKQGYTDFSTNGMENIILIPFGPKEKVTASSKRYGNDVINLGNFDGDKELLNNAAGRAKVFTDKDVPMGTSAFLFYGRSKASGNSFNVGALKATLTGDPSAYLFELQPTCANVTPVQNDAEKLEAYLNGVANAVDTLYGGAAWKNITAAQNEGYNQMFAAYSQLSTLSGFGIERMMTDLYQSLTVSQDSLAKAIRKAIANPTYATVDGSGNVTLVSDLHNFPQKYKLPVGAVSVAYSAGAFGSNAAQSYGGLAPAELNRYVYPAQLWYYANTLIKTSNSSRANDYENAASWKSILDKYENNEASVNTRTRSIALIDTIQYAVARFDVQVKTADGTTLNDNNPVVGNRAVAIPVGGYPLKAVLIGGQRNVGFDFKPLSSSTVYTIYDSVMDPNTIAANPSATVYSAANSTLVLETAEDDGAGTNDVYVALEFENTGSDFYGMDQQLIPAHGRFYLVGKLSANLATNAGLNERVFVQDYTTTARFSINNLTKAYNTIPDLKAAKLEIGMSVDLTWREGHTYDISFE
jgi:hypothetical protein